MDARMRQPQDGPKCGTHWGAAEATWSRQGPQTRTATAVNSALDDRSEETHLDIHELHEGESPARRCSLVLDEDNPPHTLRAFFVRPCAHLHCLCDRLRARQRVESTEEQHWNLCVPDVSRAIVGLEWAFRAPLPWSSTLRIVDFDASSARRHCTASFKGTVERGRRRRAVRGWRRDLDEREEWVDEGTRVLGACKLSEAEAFGDTCCRVVPVITRRGSRCGRGRRKTSRQCTAERN